jgi:hypothetical protein
MNSWHHTAVTALVALLAFCCGESPAAAPKPNIVSILADEK